MVSGGFRIAVAACIALACASLSLTATAQGQQTSATRFDERLAAAHVFRVAAIRDQGRQVLVSTGAAVARGTTRQPLLLVNNEVIRGAEEIRVLVGGTDIARHGRVASVIGSLPDVDLALIEVPGLNAPILQISTVTPSVNTTVRTMAFADDPQRQVISATPASKIGSVQSINRFSVAGGSVDVMIHDAVLPIGVSLGPVLNECTQLIGFNLSVVPGSSNAPPAGVRYAISGPALAQVASLLNVQVSNATAPCTIQPPVPVVAQNPAAQSPSAQQPAPRQPPPQPPTGQQPPPTQPPATQTPLPVQAQPAPGPAAQPSALVLRAQDLLKLLGYYNGPADGVAGTETRIAIRKFQANEGIPGTGEVAPDLLVRMEQRLRVPAGASGRPLSPSATEPRLPTVAPPDSLIDTFRIHSVLLIVGAAALLVLIALLVFIMLRRSRGRDTRSKDTAATQPAADTVAAPATSALSGPVRVSGMSSSAEWPLSQLGERGGAYIGRSDSLCHLSIEDQTVSRRHAKVFLQDGRLYLEDMDSSNGTTINGKRITPFEPHPVSPDDLIRVGNVDLKISY